MEREISIAVEMGVGMIAIAALISIIWFTVFLGKDMANDVSMESSDAIATMEIGKLEELKDMKDPIPVAAILAIYRANERFIVNKGKDDPNDVMEQIKNIKITGKARINIEYDDTRNGYILNIIK